MTPAGTATGLDSLHACHICARTGLTAAHICAGTAQAMDPVRSVITDAKLSMCDIKELVSGRTHRTHAHACVRAA